MLTIQNLTLAHGNTVLLNQAETLIHKKQKVGIIGSNGCGKSSFFDLLCGKITADDGEVSLQNNITLTLLAQSIPESERSALDFVLEGDKAYSQLINRLNHAETHQDHEAVLACHAELEATEGYAKPALAASILSGLGFSANQHSASVNHFSGGWRMRLNLARCLISPSDLLLLDEPTNHLDMEAIFWLEKWLAQSPATILVIAHDREFLDKFVTHILHFEDKKLKMYTGNYSDFELLRAQQLILQQKSFEKQQTKVLHLKSFVDRFRAKASKAKQAQSRLKQLEKMEIIAQVQTQASFSFSFFSEEPPANPLLQGENLALGYSPSQPVLRIPHFQLNKEDRIALLGPNGEGKSTFIKSLIGSIPLLAGHIHQAKGLRIGYYAQHQLEILDATLTPLQSIQKIAPDTSEQSLRDFLGRFNFSQEKAKNPLQHFSGGEKARLALALLVWQKPHVLLLDEPTNHLDLEMRAAVELALQSFTGALILISHDRHLLRSSVDAFYLLYAGELKPFAGDLDDYHQWLLTLEKKTISSPKEKSVLSKDQKNSKNRLKKLENQDRKSVV